MKAKAKKQPARERTSKRVASDAAWIMLAANAADDMLDNGVWRGIYRIVHLRTKQRDFMRKFVRLSKRVAASALTQREKE